MTETKEIYSEKAAEINQAIDKIVKKTRIPFISDCGNIEILELFEKYKGEQSRNYIQKYAETEMNNFSSKMGKSSLILALIVLVLSIFLSIFPPNPMSPIVFIGDLILLIFLTVWLFYIPYQKNLLKVIIMKIEADKLNKQSEEVKSITPETEVSEKDLKIKVEKFELNLSISAGK